MTGPTKIRMEATYPFIRPSPLNLNSNIDIVNFDFSKNHVEVWEKIQFASDDSLDKSEKKFFTKQFGENLGFVSDRLFFAANKFTGDIIGTCSSWLKGDLGRVHWVAVVPDFQGFGVGNNLMHECISRFKKLDYKKVYLHTWSDRNIAINLYLKFGFKKVNLSLT
tara:strand:+ start:10713 stop:11207 length:495 start_codon:yes stop_codon:yes gene_type:complete